MYHIKTTDGEFIASFKNKAHLTRFYMSLTESRMMAMCSHYLEPDYLESELVISETPD